MPAATREEVYAGARSRLEEAWRSLDDVDDQLPEGLKEKVVTAMNSSMLAPRYALVTQLLQKLVLPQADARDLQDLDGAPSGVSSRSIAKQSIVELDQEEGAPLGGSNDPYVSNPLRRGRLDDSLVEGPSGPDWRALLDLLGAVEGNAALAGPMLREALRAMRQRRRDLAGMLKRVLELQRESPQEGVRDERRELVSQVSPLVIEPLLPEELAVEGSEGRGSAAEVPWVRVYDPEHSPSAQQGWYLAYLFAADGSCVYLALIQGVTASTAGDVEGRAQEVGSRFSGQEGMSGDIDLRSSQEAESSRPKQYERATAIAKRYDAGAIPGAQALKADLDSMSAMLLDVYAEEGPEGALAEDLGALTAESVLEQAAKHDVELDERLVAATVAAVQAGQHVLLTGPPGTGKTTLAIALAAAATEAKLSRGWRVVTASADWTSAETVGGYWPDPSTGRLRFQAGEVLDAIEGQAWLVVDELNRADIDKAFGSLFTVLSGHRARLPNFEEVEDKQLPVEIVPAGEEASGSTSARTVGRQWRLIATLNSRDRDLLFNLSYALLRRFAVVDVPVPGPAAYDAILQQRADTGDEELNKRLSALTGLPHRSLGPAILIDCGHYLKQRVAPAQLTATLRSQALAEALQAFVLPQLDDLSRPQQLEVMAYLEQRVLKEWDRRQVAELMEATFQTPASELVSDLSSEDEPDNAEAEGAEAAGQ